MIVINSRRTHKRKNFFKELVNIKSLVKQPTSNKKKRRTLTKKSKTILRNLGFIPK